MSAWHAPIRTLPPPALATLLCASLIGLVGCANLAGVGGSAEFGCKAPIGVRCDSVSGTYYNALQQNLPSQHHGATADPKASALASRSDALGTTSVLPAVYAGKRTALVPANDRGTPEEMSAPLRSAPRVLRLWIKGWEDNDGDLHSPSYVYVPIDAGRWLIDHYRRPLRDATGPIKPPRSLSQPTPSTATRLSIDAPRSGGDAAPALRVPTAASAAPAMSPRGGPDGQ